MMMTRHMYESAEELGAPEPMLNSLIKEPEKRWISVKDELPELGKPVLLYFSSNMAVGYMGIGYWSIASGGDFYTDVADNEEQPTHWMELPAPPVD